MKIARCGFPWEKATKRPVATTYTNCETALEARYIRKTISVLERNHPAGIFRWEGAYLIEFLYLFLVKLKIDGRQVLLQLVDPLGAYDDGGDKRFGENPGQRNRGHARPMSLGNGLKDIKDAPGALLIYDGKIKGRTS
jgi:hypothetical protein